jgi:hypothetical protein
VSYCGFSKRNKLGLLPREIIERTTHDFEQGRFRDQVEIKFTEIKE